MLSHWLLPLHTDLNKSATKFCQIIHEDGKEFPLLDHCQLAFIGFDEEFSNSVRKIFYSFKNHNPQLKIAELGNVKKAEAEFIIPALKELIDSNIIPIVLGAPAHITQKMSHRLNDRVTTIHHLSNRLPDYHSDDLYEVLGFQRHLCALDRITELEEVSNNSMSLANLRANAEICEAVLRDTAFAHIDGNVIKLADNPASIESNTSGLTCAEVCQLMKHIGGAPHLKIVNVTNYEILDERMQYASSMSIAESIWYLLEGFTGKVNDHPTHNINNQTFIINSLSSDAELTFIKNEMTGRWWFSNGDSKYIACSYNEYLQASNDDIPHRLLRNLS